MLDEHISPRVASGLRAKIPEIAIVAMVEWNHAMLLGKDDDVCLREAAQHGFVFVTYDLKTILPLLRVWADSGRHHSGVILIDEKTIPPGNIGGLIRALAACVNRMRNEEWRDRVEFLEKH